VGSRLAVLAAVLGSVFSLSAIGGEPTSRPAIDIGDLEAHILSARRQIVSGEFRIAVPSRAPMYRRISYHIWFDGPKVRQEVQNDDPEVQDDNQLQVYVRNDKSAFFYAGRPDNYANPDLTRRFAVYVFPAAKARPFLFCDPRLAMMVPLQVELWSRYHVDSMVGGPGRANVAARASAWNELQSIVVSFDDPKRGNRFEYEVVLARLAGTSRGKTAPIPFKDTLECDLIEVKPGSWLPHQIRRICKRGGTTTTDEMTTLEPLEMNGAIKPIRFTLAGGHLPPNQIVIQSIPPELQVLGRDIEGPTKAPAPSVEHRILPPLWWDGKEMRPFTPTEEAERRSTHDVAQARVK
jgi:hypothetical protein